MNKNKIDSGETYYFVLMSVKWADTVRQWWHKAFAPLNARERKPKCLASLFACHDLLWLLLRVIPFARCWWEINQLKQQHNNIKLTREYKYNDYFHFTRFSVLLPHAVVFVLLGRRRSDRREAKAEKYHFISSREAKLKLLVLNNIMSPLDYSWHFANNLHAERRKEELMFK